jgi:hypothetical protein
LPASARTSMARPATVSSMPIKMTHRREFRKPVGGLHIAFRLARSSPPSALISGTT